MLEAPHTISRDSLQQDLDEHQKAAFRVFNGPDQIAALKTFLNKEENRRRQVSAPETI